MDLYILGAAWIIWCLVHSVLASNGIKKSIFGSNKIIPPWYRLLYNFLAIAGFLIIVIFQSSIPDQYIFGAKLYLIAIGETLFILGVILLLFSLKGYDLGEFIGTRTEKKTPKLHVDGFNKWVRHPLYFATIMMLVGWFCMKPVITNAISSLILLIYVFAGAWLEEKKLLEKFGTEYKDYQAKTGMWFPKFRQSSQGKAID